jgi:hypothetical protein
VSSYAFKVESQFYGPHLIYAFTVYPVTAIGTWQTLGQLSRTRRLIAVLLTLIAVQFNLDIPMFISLGKCHKVLLVPSAALVLSAVITTKWRCIYTLLTALSISALFILLAVSQVPCCHWSLSQSSPRIVDNKVAILAEGESVTGWISVSRHDKYKAMLMRSDMYAFMLIAFNFSISSVGRFWAVFI